MTATWVKREKGRSVRLRQSAIAGMAAALVLTVTYLSGAVFSLKFNLGDATIVLLALCLRYRYAALGAVFGSVLADLILGGFNYAPFTLVLKLALATLSSIRLLGVFVPFGIVLGEAAVVGGYFGADLLYYGRSAAIVNSYFNAAQGAAGCLTGAVFLFFAKKTRIGLSRLASL